jgi:type IV fimbrial biogenesis protein FimT
MTIPRYHRRIPQGLFSGGFTLIELMVTLSIAAILLVVAVPAFTAFKRNAELTSATNTLLAAINTARSEALKTGRNAFVVPTSNGSSWNAGWVVFVDMDQSQNYDASADKTILVQEPLAPYFTVTGNLHATGSTPYIMYDSSGYSRQKGSGFSALTMSIVRNDLSGSELLEQTRYLIIAKTGRARTCKPRSATDVECKVDNSASAN